MVAIVTTGIASRSVLLHPEAALEPIATIEKQQNLYRVYLRILAGAQFALAIIAAAALRFIFMVYGDASDRAAHPNRADEIRGLADQRSLFIGLAALTVLVLLGGLASGVCIWLRRCRAFSMVVAVASLLLFPIGTVFGLGTLVILLQKPVRDLYAQAAPPDS